MGTISVIHFLLMLLVVGGALRIFQATFSDKPGILGGLAQASGVIY